MKIPRQTLHELVFGFPEVEISDGVPVAVEVDARTEPVLHVAPILTRGRA